MSILNGPRLNFWGGIRTNVSVPNNAATLPIDNGQTLALFDLTTSTVSPPAQAYSDDQLNQFINAPTGVKYTAGGWNHYGQHSVDMQNVLISSQGQPGDISTHGDLIGQPLYLMGSVDPVTQNPPVTGPMMVDLDPTGTISTQIFVGGLQIGSSDSPQLLIRGNTVCSSFDVALRILEGEPDAPRSNRISGTFQLTFPLKDIVSYNQDSAILKSIIEAPGASGIVVRFVMFEMCPSMTTAELDADYAAKLFTANPSIGRMVGTLAPAFPGEPLIFPAGRQLINQTSGGTGYATLTSDELLSIDMLNIIPKQAFRSVRTDITSPIGPNADYGPVSITAGSTRLTTLSPFGKDLQYYYLYGGIVDLPLSAEQQQLVASQPLGIKAPLTLAKTTVNAPEQAYRLSADQRNIYLDDHPDGVQITLNVTQLGGPVTQDTVIKITPGPSNDDEHAPYLDPEYWDFLVFEPQLTVSKGSASVSFKVTLKPGSEPQAGFATLNFSVVGSDDGAYFINFRKFAQTSFGIAPGTSVTWDQVYEHVLRFHYLAFPAMSRYIPLNQQDAVWNARQMILARTSEVYNGTTLYMPVVHSMSPSQRALLKAWLTSEPWQPQL